MRHTANDASRRAEIHQHRAAVRQNHDVVRRNVTMETSLVMQFLQGKQYGIERLAKPALGDHLRIGTQHLSQRNATVVAHRHVRRSVPFPESKHFDQAGM